MSLSHRNAVLQKKAAKLIDHSRPITDQARTHPMQCLQVQLIVSLYWNATCRGALHSFRHCRRARREPALLRLLRELFRFFSVILCVLWIAAGLARGRTCSTLADAKHLGFAPRGITSALADRDPVFEAEDCWHGDRQKSPPSRLPTDCPDGVGHDGQG